MATAQEVIDRVRRLINDEVSTFVSGVRWSDAEILQWITDGQREIVQLKPEANPVTDWFEVADGMPRQRLDPAVAYRLIRVEANGTGSSGGGTGDVYTASFTIEPTEGAYGFVPANGVGELIAQDFPPGLWLDYVFMTSGRNFLLGLYHEDGSPPPDYFIEIRVFNADGIQVIGLESEFADVSHWEDGATEWEWPDLYANVFEELSGTVVSIEIIR